MATLPPRRANVSGQESPGPAPKSESRLIVALDFGILSTSVAYLPYMSTGAGVKGVFEKINDIHTLQDWPTRTTPFIPTEISYTPSPKGCRQWGYDIDDNSRIQKWIRMDLEDQPRDRELESLNMLIYQALLSNLVDSVPPELYKTPQQIARDYLGHVAEQVLDEILHNVGRHVPENIPIDLVVSYPSLWGEAVKLRYFQAVKLAFDVVFPKLHHIYFVGETYANAYWGVLSSFPSWERGYPGHKPRKNTSILVCKSEYGLAITATYRIVNIGEGEGSFQLHRVGYESKTNAGWYQVDQAFQALLRDRLHCDDADRLFEKNLDSSTSLVRPKLRMLESRFEAIRDGFDGKEQRLGFPVQLPRGIGTEDNPEMGILNGAIKFSVEDLKGFFDPSVDSIIGLLSRQIQVADHAGAPVKAIALSGSFACQTYVAGRITEFGRSRRIAVSRADIADTTARGSIACVVGSSERIPVLVLTMHYGICHSPRFERTKHRPEDLRISPETGNERASGQIKWLFTKGEPIFPDAESPRRERVDMIRKFRQQDFVPGNASRIVFVTCTCSVDSRPDRMLDLEPQNSSIFNLDFELSHVPETERRGVEAKGRLFGKGVLKSPTFDVNLSGHVKIEVSGVTFSVSSGSKVLVEKTVSHVL